MKWFNRKDPVKRCIVYKRLDCVHVDGLLCDFSNCNILENYKLRELEQQLNIPLKDRIDPKILEDKTNG